MTAKRFVMYGNTVYEMINNNKVELLPTDCFCLLNRLNEENEQLRHDATILIQSNQDYRKENEQLQSSDTITDLETQIMNLKEENEQLRKDVARYRGNFREMEDVKCELHEENQQLKKEVENLKQGMIHAAFTKEWK